MHSQKLFFVNYRIKKILKGKEYLIWDLGFLKEYTFKWINNNYFAILFKMKLLVSIIIIMTFHFSDEKYNIVKYNLAYYISSKCIHYAVLMLLIIFFARIIYHENNVSTRYINIIYRERERARARVNTDIYI